MKTKHLALTLIAAVTAATAAPNVELGPNQGRLIDFGKDAEIRAEITLTDDGTFHAALLDRELKPIETEGVALDVTGGTRADVRKFEVAETETGFSFPAVEDGEWLILRLTPGAEEKPLIARVRYDADHFFEAHDHDEDHDEHEDHDHEEHEDHDHGDHDH